VTETRGERVQRAKDSALRLLAVRARSRSELSNRLRRKGFDEETVETVLDALSAVDLVDDTGFARAWADERARLKPVGPARLRHELYQKGIDREIVERTLDEMYSDGRETELARAAIDRKVARATPGRADRVKLMRFLLGRGFSREVAARVINDIPENEEDEAA